MRTYILLLFTAITSINLYGQYTPNTRWPYMNEDFKSGTIYFQGNKKTSAQLNIHLWGNVLHYVTSDGKIFESNDKGVIRVEIGDKAYLFANRQLMELIGEKNGNVLLKLVKGDFDSLKEGTGAYGASLNSSAKIDLNSLDLGGMDKPELAKMQSEKNEGRDIPTLLEYYFIIEGKLLKATKKEITDFIDNTHKNEWKKYLKANKIKWKKEESLLNILNFLTQNI